MAVSRARVARDNLLVAGLRDKGGPRAARPIKARAGGGEGNGGADDKGAGGSGGVDAITSTKATFQVAPKPDS